MTGSIQHLSIGVDAGGTKTTAWLGASDGDFGASPLGTGHAGPGNPRAAGFERSTQEIAAAIQAAWNDADLVVAPVESLCLCVAGAGRQQEQNKLRRWALCCGIANSVKVTGDAEAILAAATPDNVGIALISGTGSLAWGRTSDGRVERVGGWGYLFADDGSGYAIATAALRTVARAADGRGEQTQLLTTVTEWLGVSSPFELIEWAYGSDRSRQQIAACAEVVFATAPNDAVAQRILDEASSDLAEMVTTLSRKSGFQTTEFKLGLAGGILMNQPKFLSDVIGRIGISPERAVAVPCPASGALTIARRDATH
ncbi:MAG: BadF/BadG/BcrA/BcrD ATPase family protein [Planctomycetaceae bacterium]